MRTKSTSPSGRDAKNRVGPNPEPTSALQALWPFCLPIRGRQPRPHGSDWMVGVYFLIEGTEIVYVGQSVDVQKRVDQHADNQRCRHHVAKPFDRAMWMLLPASHLRVFEGALIRRLRPKYNKVSKAPRAVEGWDAAVVAACGLGAA